MLSRTRAAPPSSDARASLDFVERLLEIARWGGTVKDLTCAADNHGRPSTLNLGRSIGIEALEQLACELSTLLEC